MRRIVWNAAKNVLRALLYGIAVGFVVIVVVQAIFGSILRF